MKAFFSLLLIVALAVTAAPCLGDDAPAKRDDSGSEKLGMKLSLQCWTYRALTFFETVDRAKTLGVRYVEAFPGQKLKAGSDEKFSRNMNDAEAAEIQQKLADTGIKLVAYGVDGIPDKDEAAARKEFEWAKKMGITVLVTETHPNDMLDKLCDEFNIRMALHNHPYSWCWNPEEVLKACQGHSKLVGSCSDLGHWMRRGLIPAEQIAKLEGRVEHSHFKDLNVLHPDGHDVVWGTGKGDPKAVLAELKRQGYKGYMSIEFEVGSVEDLDKNLPQCVAFFDTTMNELAK
jgi:sugar phosphate isomerase/epimerase